VAAPAGTFLVPQPVVPAAIDRARRERFPLGAAIEFADLEQQARLGVLERLREAEPVTWVPALGGWLVTSYALARELLGRNEDFTVLSEANLVRASLGTMMLTSDGEAHDAQRAAFDAPFRMRAVRERFEAPMAARAEALVSALAPRGRCELASEFALPFATGVAADVLGLSLDDVPKLGRLYDAFAGAMTYDGNPEPQRLADAARAELNELLLGELARVRAASDGSVTSAVATDSHHGLDDDALVAQLRVILFGAIETVQSLVVNAVVLLLDHPEQLAAVRADPGLRENAAEEAIRLIPPVSFVERWALRDLELGAVAIARGELVGISVPVVNRDPERFPEPARFDVRRPNARRHLGFAFGVHHCLGFNLARLQGALAIGVLVETLPGLRLVEAPEPTGFAFRRPERVVVAWERRLTPIS
jgi:cytochrome P450